VGEKKCLKHVTEHGVVEMQAERKSWTLAVTLSRMKGKKKRGGTIRWEKKDRGKHCPNPSTTTPKRRKVSGKRRIFQLTPDQKKRKKRESVITRIRVGWLVSNRKGKGIEKKKNGCREKKRKMKTWFYGDCKSKTGGSWIRTGCWAPLLILVTSLEKRGGGGRGSLKVFQ